MKVTFMPRTWIAGTALASLVCAAVAVSSPSGAAAQTISVRDLAPDSSTGWHPIGDDLLPPPGGGPGPVTFDKRYPYVDNPTARRTRSQPTFRVADLSNPILQPWAIEQMRKANQEVLAGKVPFRARESCLPGGVPGFAVYNLAYALHFLQTPRVLTIINPGGPEWRRVYMDVPHSAHVTPSWYGESVGHYEGDDTLVIDTIGLSTKTFVDNYRTPHTEQLHVVERFKLTGGGKMLEELITVDDPGAFTTPWSGLQRYRYEHRGPMTEDVCAENNVNPFAASFDVVPIPQAARSDF
jgi:hypothetical protein